MQYKQCALRTGHANYVSKFTVSYFLILRGSLVVEVDSKIYTQQLIPGVTGGGGVCSKLILRVTPLSPRELKVLEGTHGTNPMGLRC